MPARVLNAASLNKMAEPGFVLSSYCFENCSGVGRAAPRAGCSNTAAGSEADCGPVMQTVGQ